MGTLWGREPAMILGVIQAGIALGVTFGLHLTVEQVGAILTFSAVVLAFITRTQVTAPANLPKP